MRVSRFCSLETSKSRAMSSEEMISLKGLMDGPQEIATVYQYVMWCGRCHRALYYANSREILHRKKEEILPYHVADSYPECAEYIWVHKTHELEECYEKLKEDNLPDSSSVVDARSWW